MSTIVVTGSAGFIGKRVSALLTSQGHKVIGIDRRSGTISCDLSSGFPETEPFDILIHLAAASWKKSNVLEEALRDTVATTVHCLNAAVLNKAVFVLASSAYVFGEPVLSPQNEQHPFNPESNYGKAKLLAERIVRSYESLLPRVAIARLFNVYGPRQYYGAVIPDLIEKIGRQNAPATNGQIILGGRRELTRDYVYVDDVAKALSFLAQRGQGPYNVGSGVTTTLETLSEKIALAIGASIPITFSQEDSSGKLLGYPFAFQADNTRLRALGWEPQVNLGEGLILTIAGEKSLV